MNGVVILALAILGFSFLLSSMLRHQPDWFGRKLTPPLSRMLRAAGFVSLAIAWVVAGLTRGFAYGSVVWCGTLTIGALFAITLNTYRESLIKHIRR